MKTLWEKYADLFTPPGPAHGGHGCGKFSWPAADGGTVADAESGGEFPPSR